MNKYKRLAKIARNAFMAGLLLVFIFLTWMFSPMITSINSVGKDFFLVDKSNIVMYIRSRLITTIKDYNFTDSVRNIKATVLNESRNKNSGEMVIYDPNLPTESLKDRADTKQPPNNSNLIERYTPSLRTLTLEV